MEICHFLGCCFGPGPSPRFGDFSHPLPHGMLRFCAPLAPLARVRPSVRASVRSFVRNAFWTPFRALVPPCFALETTPFSTITRVARKIGTIPW